MRAVVLVGGEGTRLRPLTYTTPKQLLPIVELPMLERVLGALAAHGIDDAVLSLGYRPDAFAAAYPDGRAGGVRLTYVVEPEPLDTAGAIAFAARHAGMDDTFVAVNGDVLTDVDVGAQVAFHRAHGAEATLYLSPVDDPSRFGVVSTDEEGRVLEFIEKPPPGTAPTNLINAGCYVLEPEVLDRIPEGRRVSIERETFPALAAEGRLYARADDAYWLDTGTPEAYLQAHADLLGGRRGPCPTPGAEPLAGHPGSWTIGRATVAGAVGGRSLVGDGAGVAAGASVDDSVIGAGATVESGARVRRSVLFPEVTVEAGASVCDAIVGRRAVIGRGASVRAVSVIGDGVRVEAGVTVDAGRVPAGAPA